MQLHKIIDAIVAESVSTGNGNGLFEYISAEPTFQ